tara:strand:+ start:418 stop:975 length:558 start_codon:yes stop_codon:yes gene_type:complete
VILLFSGGYDSTYIALQKSQEIDILLHFKYDHPSACEEEKAARKIHSYIRLMMNRSIKLKIIDLDINAKAMFIGSKSPGARYVPNRNAIFLSIAANLAKMRGQKTILIGANIEDQENYPDCRPIFFKKMSEILGIKIEAPLLSEKRDTASDIQKEILDMSWSCYESINGRPCGSCDSCIQSGRRY